MNDIERAIEALKMENELMQFDPNTGEDYPIELQNQDNQDLYNANLVAISALEEKLNGGWIPVSEKLPPIQENVLICFSHGDIVAGYYYKNDFMKEENWYDFSYDDKLNKENIIAWQPLPEPFKEVEDED